MKLIYTLTLADYQAAQYLHWRQTLSRRATNFAVYWCLPAICSSIGLLVCRRAGLFLTELPAGYVLLLGFMLGFLINTLLAPMSRRQRFRKRFEQRFPFDRRSASIEIDNVGVSSAVLGTEEERFQWRNIVGFAQDEKMTLFYVKENAFIFFPTSALSPEQCTELNDLVARHLSKGIR